MKTLKLFLVAAPMLLLNFVAVGPELTNAERKKATEATKATQRIVLLFSL